MQNYKIILRWRNNNYFKYKIGEYNLIKYQILTQFNLNLASIQ